MAKLSKKNFDYYRDWVTESIKEHDTKLEAINQPQQTIDAYEGKIAGGDSFETDGIHGIDIIENYLFISANTVIPSLFYQVPRTIIRAKREELRYSAAVIDALVQYYFNDDAKKENQLCIMDAFLAYGYAVMKNGYNSRVGVAKKPNIFTGQIDTDATKNMEANNEVEYFKYERPVLTRTSPKDSFLDHTQPFGKGNKITFRYERTLQDLIDCNLYKLSSNFLNHFNSRTDDPRKCKLKIYEHWCMIDGRARKLVYSDEWHEELYWAKTPYKKLPANVLRFNKMPDRLYSVSQGALASKAQRELNYLNELWKEHVDKIRRQHLVYRGTGDQGITEAGMKVLKANIIDGIVETTVPISQGIYQQIVSQPMGQDVYANINETRSYLKLLLSTTGGRGGGADAKFATEEKMRAMGDQMRMAGVQDTIRDFVREQIRHMVYNIVRFGSPEITIKITAKDVYDPVTGEPITGKELQFGGPDGLDLQQEIQGDLDLDYLYDVDITSAARPDFAVIRKQLGEAIQIAMNPAIKIQLAQEGKKIEIDELMKDYFNTFDALPNADKYITEMNQQQQMAFAQQMMMQQQQENGNAQAMSAQAAAGGPATQQGLEQSAESAPREVENVV